MKCKRLTQRNGIGNLYVQGCYSESGCKKCSIGCTIQDKAVERLAELEDKIEKSLLVERYFIKKETNPMAEYPLVVGEIIADHNTFIVKEQCKTQAEAEAKLKELKGVK